MSNSRISCTKYPTARQLLSRTPPAVDLMRLSPPLPPRQRPLQLCNTPAPCHVAAGAYEPQSRGRRALPCDAPARRTSRRGNSRRGNPRPHATSSSSDGGCDETASSASESLFWCAAHVRQVNYTRGLVLLFQTSRRPCGTFRPEIILTFGRRHLEVAQACHVGSDEAGLADC